MTDLDGLKRINDTYGHLAGDKAIIEMCGLLERTCRTSDTLIRWGGDEFLVIARGLDREGAERLAERIRDAVTSHVFEVVEGVECRLSCSVGFAFFPFVGSEPELLAADQVVSLADQALYLAKRSGRNTWVGIHETRASRGADFTHLVDDELERLVEEGVVELSSSVGDRSELVWASS